MNNNTVTFIGSGAVATALAGAMHRSGYRIEAVYSRNMKSARSLAVKVKAKKCGTVADIGGPVRGILFLTIPDDAIAAVAKDLAKQQLRWNGVTVFHTSGALSSSALAPLRKKGAAVGSCHPLQTFPKGARPARLKGIWLCLEGDRRALAKGKKIAASLKLRSIVLDARQKMLYHIAAVFSSNYLVTLLSMVEDLGSRLGINERDTFLLYRPLVEATLENVRRFGTVRALTGPIARWDIDTIRVHTKALSKKELNGILSLYVSLGLATVRLATRQQDLIHRNQ